MTFALSPAARPSLYQGATFFTLQRGVDAYTTLRTGDTVMGTCGDAKVEAVIDNLQIGPLGQFFQQGVSHASTFGRGYDVRSLVDAIEDKKDAKSVDPRTIYTSVNLRIVTVSDPAIPVPTMPNMPAPVV